MKPPSLHELMGDPVYRRFVKTVPRLPESLQWGNPWAVWARRRDGKWMGGEFPTYADGWKVVVKAYRDVERFEDVTIVSKRMLYTELPAGFKVPWGFDWCARCRRPTTYAIRPNHHALRKAPVLTRDDPYRCYYCGARAALASIDPSGYYVTV